MELCGPSIPESISKLVDENGLETLKGFDAIFLGAVGAPGVPDHISLWDLLLAIRKGFDQYINLRPVKLLKGAPTPVRDASPENVDMIFVRENSEGEYAGSGAWLYKNSPNEVVIQNGVFSRKGCERVIRYAYELAKKENKTLTVRGEPVHLTSTELRIVELLISTPGRIYSAEEIYERVWNEPSFSCENTVMVHIRRIHEKIELNPREPDYLKVVWGIGYKIDQK